MGDKMTRRAEMTKTVQPTQLTFRKRTRISITRSGRLQSLRIRPRAEGVGFSPVEKAALGRHRVQAFPLSGSDGYTLESAMEEQPAGDWEVCDVRTRQLSTREGLSRWNGEILRRNFGTERRKFGKGGEAFSTSRLTSSMGLLDKEVKGESLKSFEEGERCVQFLHLKFVVSI
ncbi:hypothetical protein KM043_015023 [Ampulex compressa]|nr:hypothetical protein KM043_015023 [Ampulex compressa]